MGRQTNLIRPCVAAAFLFVVLAWPAVAEQPAVNVQQDSKTFTLGNGVLTVQISKRSGDVRSLRYKGTQILTDRSGHPGAYWSHDTSGGQGLETKITIEPTMNGGERAEVSVKGISGGVKMGHGPGASADGDFPADIEIRYCLARGESGLYTYCIFNHLPEYGAASMTEARFAAKLADCFDWMSIDKLRNKHYPETVPGEDKYVYTAIQSENRAYGFSSTRRKIGFYFINPSVEYLSGGPTKPEFLCHRDTTRVQAPVVLNYWRSSHYGGATVSVDKGEAWSRVVGPFLLYANEGPDPQAMWSDARSRADAEADQWPYAWVEADGYAKAHERSNVTGQLVLDDLMIPSFPGRIMVGLAHPAYAVRGRRRRERTITWQTDAKHYQFWVRSDDRDGKFEIPNVRSGDYSLYAFADGVPGEFSKANVKVDRGTSLDLGKLVWTPPRCGKQVWEIGIPNRTGAEFAAGNRFFEPDIPLQYPKLFPNDVTFVIGESRADSDWFFAHVPHNTDPEARVRPYRGLFGRGRASPYTICFSMDEAPRGSGVLRIALCGTETRSIGVAVNGQSAGRIALGRRDGVISRHQVQGLWYEREFTFDASMLRQGDNTLTLTVPGGSITSGVVYDYLRLELATDKQ